MMGYGDEDKGPAAAKFGVGLEIRWTDGRIIIHLSLWGSVSVEDGRRVHGVVCIIFEIYIPVLKCVLNTK